MSSQKVCSYCGKVFHSGNKNAKFCSYSCSKYAKYKKYSVSITNAEFKKLHDEYKETIRKLLFKRVILAGSLESAFQDSLIALWLCALRYKEKGESIEEMPRNYVIRTVIGAIQKVNGFDPAGIRKLTKHVGIISSLDAKVFNDSDFTLGDTLKDKVIPSDKLIDTKNLVTKIIFEGFREENIKFAVIKGEADYGVQRTDIYKEVLENYGINLSSKQFGELALRGAKKLYAGYSEEILDCLEISEKELNFTPDPLGYSVPKVCEVCGRLFIPVKRDVRHNTCSVACSRLKSNLLRDEKQRKLQQEKLKQEIITLKEEKKKLHDLQKNRF